MPASSCITDTFSLQVTSTMAVAVTKYDVLVKNNKVLVQWTTAEEQHSDYFSIQRSSNGSNFETVMAIPAGGTTNSPTHYEFTDNILLPGTSYYRLTATDKNANQQIVGTRTISNQPAVLPVNIAASPAGMK